MSQFHFVVGWLFPLQIFLSNIEHRLVVGGEIYTWRAPLIQTLVVVSWKWTRQINRDDYYDDSAFGQLMMHCSNRNSKKKRKR